MNIKSLKKHKEEKQSKFEKAFEKIKADHMHYAFAHLKQSQRAEEVKTFDDYFKKRREENLKMIDELRIREDNRVMMNHVSAIMELYTVYLQDKRKYPESEEMFKGILGSEVFHYVYKEHLELTTTNIHYFSQTGDSVYLLQKLLKYNGSEIK